MRSAILKPDVPPQSFPAWKAAEDLKQQPSKGPAKAVTNKSKAGSKRKVSNPGFDEYGDAAIDDADLALAEIGGFEDIDDFDDDLGPSKSNAKKRQKQSHTAEDNATEFVPRQLDNGKWACNHACKDKTSCKHLCCREGLDKKPKAPKPRASKKGNAATDPKQTQLSMSVNKKADVLTASQSTQTQKPGPAASRDPPKGPEFHNINALHNSIESNTPQVPLLSKPSATQQKTGSSLALPSSDRPPRPFNEVAREAEQSAFSDDFGDLNDFPLNEDSVADQPSTRMSPLLRSGSELPDIGNGHMFESVVPTQEDNFHPTSASKAQNPNAEWESLFDFDAEGDLFEPGGQDVTNLRQPAFKEPQTDLRYAGPFENMTSDSAAFDLGCKPQVRRSSPVGTHEHTNERAIDGLTLGTEAQAVHQEREFVSPGDSMQPYDKNLLVSLPENAAIPTADVSVEERPASSDSATRHFMEELGADLFNYVG